MKIFTAMAKTACEKINNALYKRDLKNAQPKAYKSTCKKTGNKFDPYWHPKYNKQLAHNKQKAQENKDLRTTFIDKFFE